MRNTRLVRGTALAAFALALSLLLVFGLIVAQPGGAHRRCTHGVSSIGPVFMKNGKIVGGDTTPHTEACLP